MPVPTSRTSLAENSENPESTSDLRLTALASGWLMSVSCGLLGFAFYMHSPGTPSAPPERWPVTSTLSLHPDRTTMLFFVHPRCPCTLASTDELEAVLSRHATRCFLQIVVAQPPEAGSDWTEPKLLDRLNRLPESSLRNDVEGREIRTFGVSTSGHVLLYSPDGELLFNGGVTASRGQAGAVGQPGPPEGGRRCGDRPAFGGGA